MRATTQILHISLIMIISLSFILWNTIPAYTGEDKTDKLSRNGSSIFSPGYINVTKYKTESITQQEDAKRGFHGNMLEFIKNSIFNKVAEAPSGKAAPELKMKTSAIAENPGATGAETKNQMEIMPYNVDIGSGDSKVYDQNGRLMSEIIGGKRHVYVGFVNVGKALLQDAIDSAQAGDVVIVKGGERQVRRAGERFLYIKNGVSMYGGYSENGVQDTAQTPTVINGHFLANGITAETEVSGFTFVNSGGSIRFSSNLTLSNNTFNVNTAVTNMFYRLNIYSSEVFFKNNTFNEKTYLGVADYYMTQPERNGFSDITLINNNFNWYAGIELMTTRMKITSTNDYYAERVVRYEPDTKFVTIVNQASRPNDFKISGPETQTANAAAQANSPVYNMLDDIEARKDSSSGLNADTAIRSKAAGYLLMSMLKSRGTFISGKEPGELDPNAVQRVVTDALEQSALSSPAAVLKAGDTIETEALAKLANIFLNPTEDQKVILDEMQAIMNDVERVGNETGSTDLKKASDGLAQVVAAVLLSQALPDLLKEGDVSNVKGVFKELRSLRDKIMLNYERATSPYYENVKKLLAENINVLQLNNILSTTISNDELDKLPRSEIDKIVKKLKASSNKSFEEGYMLQQEAKYREKYLDPNMTMLEDQMKYMLKDFTKRLNLMLAEAGSMRGKTPGPAKTK